MFSVWLPVTDNHPHRFHAAAIVSQYHTFTGHMPEQNVALSDG